jgi:hypothetical protein
MSQQRIGLKSHESLTALIGAIIMLVFWLTIATFPDFFFFNPFENPDLLRRIELTISTIGWILISTAIPLILYLFARGNRRLLSLLPVLALIWPISLVIAQITNYFQTGEIYIDYLVNFPIFFFTDIAIPLIVIVLWYDLRKIDIAVEVHPEYSH